MKTKEPKIIKTRTAIGAPIPLSWVKRLKTMRNHVIKMAGLDDISLKSNKE